MFCLFGPNGGGQNHVIENTATLQRPSTGYYEMLGMHGLKDKDAIRANLIFLAHGTHLYDELNAKENLAFALALRGQRPTDRDVKRALDALPSAPLST